MTRRHIKRTDGPPSCCFLSQSKPRSDVVYCMSMNCSLCTPQHYIFCTLAWCFAQLLSQLSCFECVAVVRDVHQFQSSWA